MTDALIRAAIYANRPDIAIRIANAAIREAADMFEETFNRKFKEAEEREKAEKGG